jgi:hypothetical protein
MMRFAVRVGLGLIVTLSASSMAAAQVVPGTKTSGRDPLLKREFSGISFGRQPESAPRPLVGWPEMRFRPIETLGAPLPSVTVAPQPHGAVPPCEIRIVPVDPNFKSRMPVGKVDERVDPKGVIRVPPCAPRQ